MLSITRSPVTSALLVGVVLCSYACGASGSGQQDDAAVGDAGSFARSDGSHDTDGSVSSHGAPVPDGSRGTDGSSQRPDAAMPVSDAGNAAESAAPPNPCQAGQLT